jgi:predicted nucleotidyltransferase
MSVSAVLQSITTALDQSNIEYMLTGSFASAYHGTPRSTQDIDVVIEATPEQLRRFVHGLAVDQYYSDMDAALQAHETESMFNVIDLSTGWKIDFILRKSRPFSRKEFRRRVRVDLQGVSVFVASAEDIVVAKLEWSRLAQSQRQIDDAAAILRARQETLDRSYIERWTRELHLEDEWGKARAAAGI